MENPGGWLTTIVARVCLNMLEARRNRREDAAGALPPEPEAPHATHRPTGPASPEDETLPADAVGVALMVVMDTLTHRRRRQREQTMNFRAEVEPVDAEPPVLVEPEDFTRAAYDRLSHSRKRAHVLAIESAKKPETRARRIDKALADLRAPEHP